METSMVPYLIGLLAGVLVGLIPIPVGEGVTLKLGMAGGVWVAARVLADATLVWMYFLMGVLGFVLGAGAGYRLGGWLGLVARGDSAEIRRRTD